MIDLYTHARHCHTSLSFICRLLSWFGLTAQQHKKRSHFSIEQQKTKNENKMNKRQQPTWTSVCVCWTTEVCLKMKYLVFISIGYPSIWFFFSLPFSDIFQYIFTSFCCCCFFSIRNFTELIMIRKRLTIYCFHQYANT